jgi:hypothetical protein
MTPTPIKKPSYAPSFQDKTKKLLPFDKAKKYLEDPRNASKRETIELKNKKLSKTQLDLFKLYENRFHGFVKMWEEKQNDLGSDGYDRAVSNFLLSKKKRRTEKE